MMFFIYFWNWLFLISLVLIFFRKDSFLVLKDLANFIVRPLPFSIVGIILMYLLLPLTIPFSIKNIISNNENDK
jgi:hypothetical protein